MARRRLGLEPGHHRVPRCFADPAVQVGDLAAEPGRQVRPQHRAELGVLGEQQCALAAGEHLFEDLLQPSHLAGTSRQRAAVAEQVGRMVAHLFQLGHRGEHQPAPLIPSRLSIWASMSSTIAW